MANRAVKEHHHTTPEMYLRGFTDETEHVSVRRRNGDELDLHITNVTVRSGFYNVRNSDGVLHDAVENWFMTDVETPAGPVLRRLREGEATGKVSADDTVIVSRFVAAQLYRTATARSYMEQVDKHLGPFLLLIEVTKNLGIDIRRLSADDLTKYMGHAANALHGHQTAGELRASQLRTMVREIDKLMTRLEKWHWWVVEGDDSLLITGDAPAIGFQPQPGVFRGLLPAGSPAYLPLSPTRLLVGTRAERSPGTGFDARLAFAVNQRIANESADGIMKATWQDWPENVHMPERPPRLPRPRFSFQSSPTGTPTFPAAYPSPSLPSIRSLLDTLEASDVVE